MVVLVGLAVVLIAVLVGYSMAGGHIEALIHVSEFVTIGGASLGAMIVMSPPKVLKDVVRAVVQVVKGTPYNKKAYLDLFGVMNEIARMIRRDGNLALEPLVADPKAHPLFQKYPKFGANHHAVHFLCDGLAFLIDGKPDPEKLAAAMEEEMKVIDREHHAAVGVLSKTADALPGFGIVAAVLGIVVTMQAIDGPASEIGHKVGAALVGTFLGILASYGFFAPLAGRMELQGEGETVFFKSMTAALVAIAEGDNARDVVSRARRLVGTDVRPTQAEMAAIFQGGG